MRQTTLCLLFFMATFFSVQAQFSAEAGLTFQTKVKKAGVQVKGVYDVTEKIAGAAGINFIFSESAPGVKTSLTEINLDGHYMLLQEEKFSFYPLAGLNFTRSKVKFDTQVLGDLGVSNTTTGLNVGGGILLPISDAIRIVVEAKGVLAGDNGSRVGLYAGANYAF